MAKLIVFAFSANLFLENSHVSGSRIINTLINTSGSRIMIYASYIHALGSKIKDHRYRVIFFTGSKFKNVDLG